MDAKYLKYLDYNTQLVQLETTSTGRVNVLGVEDYIKEFAEENDIFFGKGAAPRINTSRVGTTDTQEITAKDLIRLEKENPEKYREMMKKRLRLA